MITQENFQKLLEKLKFQEKSAGVWRKNIGKTFLEVDFHKKELLYPEEQGLKINERQTCNFSQDENFVVFECVHRLLEKGYRPEDLELEPKWKLGKGASGGRADILIRDQQKNALLIIECKTAGREFEKAWRDTQEDGGQLFSYAQQEQKTKYLCLYASDFENQKVHPYQRIISHQDNQKILEQDEKLLSFEKASGGKERFAVWRGTYKLNYTEKGIFEQNVQTYQIGKDKYTLEYDTEEITNEDKKRKYHEFATILRKHNVARRETAFEVLVNLFLCKIVDEKNNPENLKFYWKGLAYDSYFNFVDGLQKLYQIGMEEFLGEKISYVSSEQIDNAFWAVKNDKDATKKQIQKYFRELKFFSNSAFSFIDTHNEQLFYQNTKVLLEVIRMWQNLRLKTEEQNQFLGDMFEYFLDNSIKQTNGQFFTPLPICKFIVSSLPLKQKVEQQEKALTCIDYACGSGHFLNEYAYQIKNIVETENKDLNSYYEKTFGIEKEGRLAKIAKVAALMYGQEKIKILSSDALADNSKIPLEKVDVLVANPPFAVEGFLLTLNEDDRKKYQLLSAVDKNKNTNAIQCFFIERIHHLMVADGVVGVILPSSILANNDKINTQAREILLEFFDFISIVELGSGAFGKTGTQTIVLFLRRKEKRPEEEEHYFIRVEQFFDEDKYQNIFRDQYLIHAYCNHIEVPFSSYKKVLQNFSYEDLEELLQYPIFQDYSRELENSTLIKNLKTKRIFQQKSTSEQKEEIHQQKIKYFQEQEQEKLKYFILSYQQKNEVLLVKAPNENKEQKKFLGYEWSGAKGKEGIKYLGADTVHNIITPLFDPKNLDAPEKINSIIRKNFAGEKVDALPPYCQYAPLTSLLDFSKTTFDKAINLTPKKTIEIKTKWELVELGKVIETIESGNRPKGGVGNITAGAFSIGGEHIHPNNGKIDLNKPKYIPLDFYEQSKRGILKENDILICKDGALTGKIALLKNELSEQKAMINEHIFLLRCKNETKQKYIFQYLFSKNGQDSLKKNITGAAQGGLNSTNLKNIKIPVPPLEIQQKIVAECEAVDKKQTEAEQKITSNRKTIAEKVQQIINANYEKKRLGEIAEVKRGKSITQIETLQGNIKVVAGGIDFAYYHNQSNRSANVITVSGSGANAGYVNYWKEPIFASDCTTIQGKEEIETLFYYNILKFMQKDIFSFARGAAQPHVYPDDLKNIEIPVPPLATQQKLLGEITPLEQEIETAQQTLKTTPTEKTKILEKHL